MKHLVLVIYLLTVAVTAQSANTEYKKSKEYLALRDSMRHAFNNADSASFFPALSRLENYVLKQNDLHEYYTQRCNEIVFQMNRQRIFEAYKLARQLSLELRERKLDSEMYMAYNMLGHLNRYCGNKETARECFYKVIKMMEEYGYYESMPPIYMNIVNVEIGDDPEEAQRLLEKAAEISAKYAPERVFDIETRKTLSYFNSGNIEKFLEGYKKYHQGVAKGQSSVHGRSVDVYYEACMGHTDKAVQMAKDELGDEGKDAITMIYERAGRWQEAYQSLRQQTQANDSINNVVLSNTMQGFRDELTVYDIERNAAKVRTITMAVIIILLVLLVVALGYIVFSHHRHLNQLQRAYQHALESDKMKTAFIQNMSHEVRTPLNVISGFAQIIADPDLNHNIAERQKMAQMMLKNTSLITNQIEEMLILSLNETSRAAEKNDTVAVNELLAELKQQNKDDVAEGVTIEISSTLSNDFKTTTHRNMLKRMLNALIDNAIKNTTKGVITLGATTDDTHLTLTVEDTGCGIPAGEAEHIFERFVKLDTFKAGLGLGLPICRQIANRLGGIIRLDTSYKNGARFIVTLPV